MQTLVAPVRHWLITLGVKVASALLALVCRFDCLLPMLHLPQMQPLLEKVGRLRAQRVFQKAVRKCPAYRQFVTEADTPGVSAPPVTTKENYIRCYPIAARCYGGAIPLRGTLIDESSWSSGVPNQWVRSRAERRETVRSLQRAFRHVYPDAGRILLNCFALGPWATGMTVSLALADAGILKSLGADAAKLENTLRTFGPGYRYLVCGYPPFIRNFLASTDLDLRGYHLDLVVGGEGMSEALRERFLTGFRSVFSSYGASDLEINVGLETPRTVQLRRACAADPVLCQALFGRDTPPMLFQYHPLDYVIETLDNGELAFTLTRRASAAPKIRYNLRDLGGTLPWRAVEARLRGLGRTDLTQSEAGRQSAFPLLWVWGRNDCSVPFCGAKVFPGDVEAVLSSREEFASVSNFQLAPSAGDTGEPRLRVALELRQDVAEALPSGFHADVQQRLFDGLRRVNQDFREVTRCLDKDCLELTFHSFGEGPFAGYDARIKARYIGPG